LNWNDAPLALSELRASRPFGPVRTVSRVVIETPLGTTIVTMMVPSWDGGEEGWTGGIIVEEGCAGGIIVEEGCAGGIIVEEGCMGGIIAGDDAVGPTPRGRLWLHNGKSLAFDCNPETIEKEHMPAHVVPLSAVIERESVSPSEGGRSGTNTSSTWLGGKVSVDIRCSPPGPLTV
jgi:hypothetical protein